MTTCPLCGSSDTRLFMRETLSEKKDPFSVTGPTYGSKRRLRSCRGCQVLFADPLPSEEELAESYEGLEDPFYLEEKGRAKAAEEVLFLLERTLGRRGRILDVGCFCGTLLSEARRLGWEVEGIEPSRWAREKAREAFGLEIGSPSLKTASFPQGSFDAVTVIDVLEHFLYPKEELGNIHRVLKEGGVLYLSTPDVGSLAPRILRGRWWGYRPEHLFYFSRRSLRSLLTLQGFQPVWEGFYRRSFTFGELLRRLQGVSPAIHHLLSPVGRLSFLQERMFFVNLFDQIALIAKKRGP